MHHAVSHLRSQCMPDLHAGTYKNPANSCQLWGYGLALALVTWSNIIQRAVRGTSQDKTRQDKTSELNLQN